MHAFFKGQDSKPYDYTKVVVKRSIPCVWIFMKRRRTKDYKVVFEKLNFEAEKNNLALNPTSAMISTQHQQVLNQTSASGTQPNISKYLNPK
jgi:hypothetical protein